MDIIQKETDTFEIDAENPKETQDGEVQARVTTRLKETNQPGYDEKVKITGRAASEYANNIQDIYELDEDERTELKTEIMKLKNELRTHAVQQEQEEKADEEDEEMEEKFDELLYDVFKEGGTVEKGKFVDKYNVMAVIDHVDPAYDYILPAQGKLTLNDEGRKRVQEYLGFESFDGDPEAEAQKQLKDNPLRYYLDSFNKIHKGDHLLKIWEMVSALSSTCSDRQIHSWAVGPSGKGKSHLKRELLKFLPPEAYEQKESFSPKALQYKSQNEGTDYLDHQLVYFDEVGENIENAIELIRLLTDQDKDEIRHETVKDQEVIDFTLDTGNVTVWFTSVETIQDEQLKNRFILTNPDASSAQDDTVNQHQQNILNYGGDLDFIPKEAPVIQRMVRDIRENTPQYKPIVPFKINWKQKFNRRLYPFFYTLMGMIAKIHYKNRETRGDFIIVTRADFELAKLIWGKLIDTTVAQTDEQSIALLKQLPDTEEEALTRRELRMRLNGFSTNKVARTCDKLEETEELQLINTSYNNEMGEYVHWAGADVEKLVDNQPEIRNFNEEVVAGMLSEAGIDIDDNIIDTVFNTEIEVTEYLRDRVEEKRHREDEEDNTPELPDITNNEEKVINFFHEYDWDVDLNTLENMYSDEELDVVKIAMELDDKGVIRLDGDNEASPTSKLDRLKAEDEVTV